VKYLVLFSVTLLVGACGGGKSFSQAPMLAPTNSNDECSLPYSADYPDTYEGSHPIPIPGGIMPSSIVTRSVSFKDYNGVYGNWKDNDGDGLFNNCTKQEFSEKLYSYTLERIKATGANSAWIYNYGPWVDAHADNLEVYVPGYSLSDELVEWLVREAAGMGIDIFYAWQLWTIDQNQTQVFEMGSTPTMPVLKKLLDGHETNMINQAMFLENLGVKRISLDWNAMSICFCGDNRDELLSYYLQRLSDLADHLRSIYSGEIEYGQIGRVIPNETLFSKIDSLYINPNWQGLYLSEEQNSRLTVDMVRDAALDWFEHEHSRIYCLNTLECTTTMTFQPKPVTVGIQIQSRDRMFIDGWVEDGFCTKGILDDGSLVPCIQDYYISDFSVQAIGYEGIFKAIEEQSYFNITGIDIHTGFWLTDTLIGNGEVNVGEGFPNISQSIRGKPAEDIVQYWFNGINP
jgi:hypothetical protein